MFKSIPSVHTVINTGYTATEPAQTEEFYRARANFAHWTRTESLLYLDAFESIRTKAPFSGARGFRADKNGR